MDNMWNVLLNKNDKKSPFLCLDLLGSLLYDNLTGLFAETSTSDRFQRVNLLPPVPLG